MYYDLSIYMFLLFVSLSLMMLKYKYYLLVLIILELVVMNMGVVIYVLMGIKGMDFILIYFLVFSVCESVLGLGILVLIIRMYGNDFYNFFYINKF